MKKIKILITGGTGLLGTHLLLSKPNNCQVFATVHDYKKVLKLKDVAYVPLDVRNGQEITKVINSINPEIVIHTAAHSSVDFCQKNQEEAYQTNSISTKYIVESLKKINGKLLFCSTNMTYDGLNHPYNEKSRQHPQTFYGKTKVDSEKIIVKSKINYSIIRLMTMYGWNWQPERKNMISMAIGKLRENQELWMTNDVFNNLLYVGQAAEFFWDVTLHPEISDFQKFNIAGAECVNRFQATMKLCEIFDLNKKLVHEVKSSYFQGQETPRSPNTCFDTTKIKKLLKFQPYSLSQGLTQMKNQPLPKKFYEES